MDEKNIQPDNRTEEVSEVEGALPVYANNIRFEMTAWDLRILFGQLLPLSEGKGQIDWHTDVTLPWARAKLMHLHLGINLALYERENGKIMIPPAVLPVPMSEPPEDTEASNVESLETFRIIQRMIEAFREKQLPQT